jgi:hypothetical protein
MPATLQKPSPDHKLDPEHQQLIKCTYCDQRFVLTWDDKEWMSAKDWLRVAALAVRKSHPRHVDDPLPLPSTVKGNIHR